MKEKPVTRAGPLLSTSPGFPMLVRSLLASLALAGTVAAQTLVLDINEEPAFGSPPDGGLIGQLEVDGVFYFNSVSEATGRELWKTDGTPGGTELVIDLWPGVNSGEPREMTQLPNGMIVMSGVTAPVGREIFRTDGTAAGTKIVYDVRGGPISSNPHHLTLFDGQVYFLADDQVHGSEWWRTDGTTAGTELFIDLVPGPLSHNNGTTDNLVIGDTMYFSSLGSPWEQTELWKTDGTVAGTEMVATINDDYLDSLHYLTEFQGKLFFVAENDASGEEIWVSDGTTAGTHVFVEIGPNATDGDPAGLTVAGDKMFFSAWQQEFGTELWVTDGTPEGTNMVADLASGEPFFNSSSPNLLSTFGNYVLFSAFNPSVGNELWISAGTLGTTQLVADLDPGVDGSKPSYGTKIGSLFYYRATTLATGSELFVTDGSAAGTGLVADIVPGPEGSSPSGIRSVGTSVVFAADDGEVGSEPWVSDGTEAGTELLVDVALPSLTQSSSIQGMVPFDGRVFFGAESEGNGRELWSSDGTAAGTQLFFDIQPGLADSFPVPRAVAGGLLFFTASTPAEGHEVWSTDGTVGGTALVADINPGASSSNAHEFAAFDGRVFFSANDGVNDSELWVSDGTAAGTELVYDFRDSGTGGSPEKLTVIGDTMFFFAISDEGRELWTTDGTTEGTEMVIDSVPGPDYGVWHQSFLIEYEGKAYYVASDGVAGYELWSSDGTEAGSGMVIELMPGLATSFPSGPRIHNGWLVFNAQNPDGGAVYRTDGTALGTEQFLDDTHTFIESGDWLLYFLEDINTETNMWRTDGTPGGEEFVTTLDPFGFGNWGPVSVTPGPGPVALFQGYQDATGNELWRTDGTAGGTYLVADIAPGGTSSSAGNFHRVGNTIFFGANDGLYGSELHSIDLSSVGAYVVAPFGEGCAGSTGIPTIEIDGAVTVGSTFDVVVANTPPTSVVIPAFSLSAIDVPLGAGCSLYLDTPAFLPAFVTDVAGSGSMPITPTASLIGANVFFQAVVADPGGALLGIASLTGGLETVVGS